MRKTLAALLGAAMVITLGACTSAPTASTSASAGAPAAGKTIYVLGPTPDHGWTAQAGTFAEAKVDEIKAAGKYKAEYQASSDGEAQNDLVQNIIANGDAAGVVFFGLDDSAKSGQEALIAAKIPFISFDRIIEGPDKSAVLNFSGDNWAVGAGIGYWLQKNGMKPGDALVTLIGDNGTVSGRRPGGLRPVPDRHEGLHRQGHRHDVEDHRGLDAGGGRRGCRRSTRWSATGARTPPTSTSSRRCRTSSRTRRPTAGSSSSSRWTTR